MCSAPQAGTLIIFAHLIHEYYIGIEQVPREARVVLGSCDLADLDVLDREANSVGLGGSYSFSPNLLV